MAANPVRRFRLRRSEPSARRAADRAGARAAPGRSDRAAGDAARAGRAAGRDPRLRPARPGAGPGAGRRRGRQPAHRGLRDRHQPRGIRHRPRLRPPGPDITPGRPGSIPGRTPRSAEPDHPRRHPPQPLQPAPPVTPAPGPSPRGHPAGQPEPRTASAPGRSSCRAGASSPCAWTRYRSSNVTTDTRHTATSRATGSGTLSRSEMAPVRFHHATGMRETRISNTPCRMTRVGKRARATRAPAVAPATR